MAEKTIPVHSARMAIKDHNKNLEGFNQLMTRFNYPQPQMPQDPNAPTLDTHMMQQGQQATPSAKSALANKMGMQGYSGTPEQDNKLMQGAQGQAMAQSQGDQMSKEHDLKDREMKLKESQAATQKPPTAEEIAQALLSKIK